jgi:hypothetical protein
MPSDDAKTTAAIIDAATARAKEAGAHGSPLM